MRVALESTGRRVLSVAQGNDFARNDANRVTCNPLRSQDFDDLLADVPGDEPLGIVHLWSLDAPQDETTTLESLEHAQQVGALAVMRLAQALSRKRRAALTRIVVVTEGAQPASGAVTSAAQAPIWGMGATLAREFPELRTTLIDLDAGPRRGERLFAEICRSDDEPRVALRDEQRLVPRLVRGSRSFGGRLEAAPVRVDRTYLITGGAGAIGLVIAERLCERGARHFGILGRRPLDGHVRARLAALTAKGAHVHYVAADIADANAFDRAMTELADCAPPVAGIVHAAGVVNDSMMVRLSIERAGAVMAPKIRGTWNLHVWSRDRNLDFFVMCSSIAGLFGSAGQAPYAAGNAFLDAVAHARRRSGLAGQSIDWGGWADTGMVARMNAADPRRRAPANRQFSRTEGGDLIEAVLADSSRIQVVAIRSVGSIVAADDDRLLQEFRSGGIETGPSAAQKFAQTAVAPRAPFVRQHLRVLIGQVLDRSSDEIANDVPFDALGLDSLMLITCRRRVQEELGIVVPTMSWYDNNTVERLADYVAERLASGGRDSTAHERAPSPPVELNAQGAEPPLYLVHPVGGTVTGYGALAGLIGRRTFGFEASGISGGEPLDRIDTIADAYIDALLRQQPEGPYLLAGWSLGGCIAYEMARRLHAMNRDVALVALIDTHHPSMLQTAAGRDLVRAALLGKVVETDAHQLDERDSRAAMLRHFLWDYAAQMQMPPADEEGKNELWRAFERTGTLGPVSRDDALRLFGVFQANVRAHRRYVPGEYSGRVLLVRSTEAPTGKPDLGWRDLVPNLEVREIAGDHYTLLRTPHVERLGVALSASIDTALRCPVIG